MYQRNTTNNDYRRHFVIQNHYFTYQRKSNNNDLELMVQTLQQQVNDMQAQINNINSGGSGGDPDGIGTSYLFLI